MTEEDLAEHRSEQAAEVGHRMNHEIVDRDHPDDTPFRYERETPTDGGWGVDRSNGTTMVRYMGPSWSKQCVRASHCTASLRSRS